MRFIIDKVLLISGEGEALILIGDDKVWIPLDEIYCEDELDEGTVEIEIDISEDLAIEKGIEAYAEDM
jgi:hypothetical protein